MACRYNPTAAPRSPGGCPAHPPGEASTQGKSPVAWRLYLLRKPASNQGDKCNSGWMSRIVDLAKPTIMMLLRDNPSSISPDNQQRLAAWVALTCVIAEHLRRDHIIVPIPQRRYLMNNQQASADWSIAIGVYTGRGFYFRYLSTMFKGGRVTANPFDQITQEFESDRDNAVFFSFTVGTLFIQAFLSVESVMVANNYLQWIDGSNTLARIWPHRRLWPFPAKAVKWPPRESIDDNTARTLADYYYNHRLGSARLRSII